MCHEFWNDFFSLCFIVFSTKNMSYCHNQKNEHSLKMYITYLQKTEMKIYQNITSSCSPHYWDYSLFFHISLYFTHKLININYQYSFVIRRYVFKKGSHNTMHKLSQILTSCVRIFRSVFERNSLFTECFHFGTVPGSMTTYAVMDI